VVSLYLGSGSDVMVVCRKSDMFVDIVLSNNSRLTVGKATRRLIFGRRQIISLG
jgi:hypothetical protein